MGETSPEIVPPQTLTDEEYLNQAELEIRGYANGVRSRIYAIGKKLVEIKLRVGHGKFEAFVHERLGFRKGTIHNYINFYKLIRSLNIENLETLKITDSAIYQLGRRSTPDHVRVEALEKARTGGISDIEVEQLITGGKAKEAVQVKNDIRKTVGADVGTETEASGASPAEQISDHERVIPQREEPIAEPEGEMPAQTVWTEIDTKNQHEVVSSQDQTPSLETTIKESTAAAIGEEVADKKQPPDLPLSFRVTKAREAIVNCVGAIKLTPDQCLAAETESGLAQIALASKSLIPWLKKLSQLYAKKLKGEQLPLPLDHQLPADPLPLFTQATPDEGHHAIAIKRVSTSPGGSRNNRPRKAKSVAPSTDTGPREMCESEPL